MAGRSFGVRSCEEDQREATSGRVTGNDDPLGPLFRDATVDRSRVVDGGREGMFRGESVLGNEGRCVCTRSDLADEVPVRVCRAEHVASAVQVLQCDARPCALGAAPDPLHAADRALLVVHSGSVRSVIHHVVEHAASVRSVELAPQGSDLRPERCNEAVVLVVQGVADLRRTGLIRCHGSVDLSVFLAGHRCGPRCGPVLRSRGNEIPPGEWRARRVPGSSSIGRQSRPAEEAGEVCSS